MTSILEQIKPWIDDETGMIQSRDGGRDNLVLHTARLVRRLNKVDRITFAPVVENFFKQCEIPGWPGLLRRYPGHTGENSIDNLIGAIVLSSLLGIGYEDKILKHAQEHLWIFNTESPGKIRFKNFGWWKDWTWKSAGLPPLLKRACVENVTKFDRAAYTGSIYFLEMFSKGTSDVLLQDDMNSIMRGYFPTIDTAIGDFDRWVIIKFGSICGVNSDYYGPNHPFALNFPGVPT